MDCETRICEAQKRNFLRRFAAAALVFTLILGNCYHTYENSPLFLKNQDNKKELLVDREGRTPERWGDRTCTRTLNGITT